MNGRKENHRAKRKGKNINIAKQNNIFMTIQIHDW